MENPKDFPKADALILSEMVNETPIVKLDDHMCTGPTANYVWSLDNKHFFSIEQLIDQMKEMDTLKCKKWPSVCVTGFHMLEIPDATAIQ